MGNISKTFLPLCVINKKLAEGMEFCMSVGTVAWFIVQMKINQYFKTLQRIVLCTHDSLLFPGVKKNL